jgi:hypothetical protein
MFYIIIGVQVLLSNVIICYVDKCDVSCNSVVMTKYSEHLNCIVLSCLDPFFLTTAQTFFAAVSTLRCLQQLSPRGACLLGLN